MSDNDQLPMIDAGKFIDYVWNMRKERDQLRAEVEALRKDAGRYRWLRDEGDSELVVARMRYPDGLAELECEVADYDAAIDAAMAKEGSANEL